MARKSNRGERGHIPTASRDPLHTLLLPRPVTLSTVRVSPLIDVSEDRREWHPERQNRPFLGAPRSATQIVAKQRPAFQVPSQTKAILAFAEPEKVPVCVRRGVRREVLHALKIAGGSGMKKRKMTPSSKISCS